MLLLFGDPLFTGRVFYYRDVARFFYPNYHYAVERLRQGALPLWNPYVVCGHPFLGSWYPGALYPLVGLMVLCPLPHSFTAFMLLHSYLALATMYLLVRSLSCGRAAAAVGALTFGLSGFALSVADYPNSLASLAWAPLVFQLVRRALCRPVARSVAAAAVAIALQVFAGGPEMVWCTWFITGLYGAAKVLGDLGTRAGRAAGWPRLAALAGVFVLGALLAAVQLVPFAEVFHQSVRGGGYGLVAASAWAVPPVDLFRFVVPDLMTVRLPIGLKWTSQVWLKSFYLGLVPWVFAGIALFRARERRTLFLAGLAAGGMVLALGEWTPLWVLAYYGLPGAAGMRYPAKFMMIPTFAVALLAALGAEWLVRAEWRRRRRTLVCAAAVAAALLVAVVVFIGRVDGVLASGRVKAPRLAEAYQNTRQSLVRTAVVLGAMVLCLGALAAAAGPMGSRRPPQTESAAAPHCPSPPRGEGRVRGAHGPPGKAATLTPARSSSSRAVSLTDRGGRRRWTVRLGAVALGLVLVADTYHHHRPQVMTAHPDIYRTRPASLERLEGLPQPARVSFHFTPAARDYIERSSPSAEGRGDPLAVLREIYLRNLPMLYDVQSVHGLVPTWPWRFETLHAFLSKRHDPLQRPLTDFLSARLLIDADEKDTQPTLRTIRFEANPRALPRATLVHRQSHRAFTGAAALADWLTSNDFNPREEVWLEETHHVAHPPPGVHPAPPRAGAPQGVAADRVQITRYEPERIEMQVESTAPGYLVVADQFFPGWRAEVAGRAGSQANVSTGPLARGSRSTSARPSMPAAASRRAEVLRANLCFRAVAVDAGVFTVTMTYRPWTVALGGVLSAVAALVAAGLGVFGRARSQQSTR